LHSRRDFLQFSAVAASLVTGGCSCARQSARQALSQDDLLRFQAKGKLTLLHLTDLHAQLKPMYFRPPSQNIGVGSNAAIPPHLVGDDFLRHFGVERGSALAYAHTMIDYVDLAKAYGRLGGLDRISTLVQAIRAERGDGNVLLLDGGDTWQGSYTALKTKAQDMVECMGLLQPDAMVGHWEFTLGANRVREIVDGLGYPFLASNIVDTDWEEPVFESTSMVEAGGSMVAIIGQAMPYTPISNPRHLFPEWAFGLRLEALQKNVDAARLAGADVVVLLSHNGFDVDRKLAADVRGIDVILTGHTHDAIPEALQVNDTLILASGSHGKYLGRIDLEVKNGKVVDYSSKLIPVFSDVITPDAGMAAKIDAVRKPFAPELDRVIGKTDSTLYRRGNFNGTWDDVICDAMLQERDAELCFSPGFRWGTTLLPGDNITVDDMYTQTAITYPEVYRQEFSGARIQEILEDVCDNLFNSDPYAQQGGDMVRVGGLGYTCTPSAAMGSRISDLTVLATGQPIDLHKNYVVAGWGSVQEGVEGPPIYDVLERYISQREVITMEPNTAIKVK